MDFIISPGNGRLPQPEMAKADRGAGAGGAAGWHVGGYGNGKNKWAVHVLFADHV